MSTSSYGGYWYLSLSRIEMVIFWPTLGTSTGIQNSVCHSGDCESTTSVFAL